MSRIGFLPWALFITTVPLFLITISVTWAFNSPSLYNNGFEKYSISRSTGITNADLRQVGADIRSYINSSDEPMDIQTSIFGVEQDLFNPKEIAHMRDVKNLVRGVYILALVSVIYLSTMTLFGFIKQGRLFTLAIDKRLAIGGGLTMAMLILFSAVAAMGFDSLFIKFHEISFANDFWRLNPRTDYLVRIFPDNFWFDATVWVALRAIVGALIITASSSSYLVYSRYKSWQI
ncbi:MAG: TIGR01906 family membrane protein [Chloroflexota bacterium]|nr:TIGR01906 family membrane protein [Chloroflexota bacterium]